MLSALRRLLGRGDALTTASRRGDRDAFLRLLARSDVTVLAALDGPGLDVATLTPESLLADMRRRAESVAAAEDWLPFVYTDDEGHRWLPFFSTPRHAEAFCGAYSSARGRVWGWETLIVKGTGLCDLLPHCDGLVLNAGTPDEHRLSCDDLERLWRGVSNPPPPSSRSG